jgi:hypothetical protein
MPNTAQNTQSKVHSAVTVLEGCLFVRASELQSKVTIAAKDAGGQVCWITLDSSYHSRLVRTAIAAAKANSPTFSVASIKGALFIFLLNILNGKPQQSFFYQEDPEQKGATTTKRTMTGRTGNQTSDREHGTCLTPPPTHPRSPSPPQDRPPATEARTQYPKPHPSLPPTPPPAPPTITADAQTPEPTAEELDEVWKDIESQIMQDVAECEALLKEVPAGASEERTTNTNRTTKKSNRSATQPTSRKRAVDATPVPTPPTTRQASKGRLRIEELPDDEAHAKTRASTHTKPAKRAAQERAP